MPKAAAAGKRKATGKVPVNAMPVVGSENNRKFGEPLRRAISH
jgi:hypothetical protein